jgi:hypothetical protein
MIIMSASMILRTTQIVAACTIKARLFGCLASFTLRIHSAAILVLAAAITILLPLSAKTVSRIARQRAPLTRKPLNGGFRRRAYQFGWD